MTNPAKSIYLLIVIAIIAVIAGIWMQSKNSTGPENLSFEKLIILPTPRPILDREFTTHLEQAFTKNDFLGKWTVLFFGFTNCPDICPTTMHTLKLVKQQLQASGHWSNYRVAMVTVDPQRDSAQRLAQYVPYFDQEFIGLTGALDDITEFAKKLGILFVARSPDERGNYDVDHSAALILLNPAGQMAGVISAPHEAATIARDLTALAQAQPHEQTEQPAAIASATISTAQAWVRAAPPTAESLAAYLTIRNTGSQAVSLVGAHSPLFDEVMIHQTSVAEGMASMQHLDKVELAAGAQLEFQPMGTHLMLLDPERTLAIGDQVPITLVFENHAPLPILFTVQASAEASN